jgi:hypothetical protein
MVHLVECKPRLFWMKFNNEQWLYDPRGLLLSVKGVHWNLVEWFSITLKEMETKFLVSKYAFVKKIEFFSADFLVFTSQFQLFFIDFTKLARLLVFFTFFLWMKACSVIRICFDP